MLRLAVSAAAILACVPVLAACGGNDGSGNGTSVSQSGDTSAGSGSGKTGTPLAGTDPCTLLKPEDVPEAKPDPSVTPSAAPLGDGRRCQGDDYAVTISDVDADGYAVQFEGSVNTPLPDINGYKAAKREDGKPPYQSCAVLLAVTANELVTVAVGLKEDQDPSKTCEVAQKAATVVTGRIPR
ncbi:DUF3558 family protein [Amycolatopsis benzoatilytica]|uniref:DUF3558 family protein n=1 Tax=Amycolatopsis benzoatilytica TaxID=346045 RepID=UPI0007C54A68|nr:DUF3558 family protein [Amycolatopsis benzoatilytica]